jgi:hypothetical protein
MCAPVKGKEERERERERREEGGERERVFRECVRS